MARARSSRKRGGDEDAHEDNSASDFGEESESSTPQAKRRKVNGRPASRRKTISTASVWNQLFSSIDGQAPSRNPAGGHPCKLPGRVHALGYHRPLLLDSQTQRKALLGWFDSVSKDRSMPWRKAWINPRSCPDTELLRGHLERRAYEVWISEIMLQQTRVAVVIDYWNKWIAKWPTIHDLAAADPDDVLAAWRGLGYYSRATRIHEAAKLVCKDDRMQGLLPAGATELADSIPGVGKYTAGAISAIVFGRAAPMVDGNVLRVLSRQLGVLGNVKTDKTVIDMLWAAADALVKAVAADVEDGDGEDASGEPVTDRPGRWGQALMELGSTICTPKPNCAACPITSTCRAFTEGQQLSRNSGQTHTGTNGKATIGDIEDACGYCIPLDFAQGEGEPEPGVASKEAPVVVDRSKTRKQATLQAFAFTQSAKSKKQQAPAQPMEMDSAAYEAIADHARKFPVKAVKKAVREEATLVCAVRHSSNRRYLIHKRPEKGLLAGLWEFPSHIVSGENSNQLANDFVSGLLDVPTSRRLKHVGSLGSLPWLFSHIKLTMHVHLFELQGDAEPALKSRDARYRWSDAVDDESMGTGMRKCWALIQEAAED